MRVLVTGATGFIGSHLVRRLRARPGTTVTPLLREDAELSRMRQVFAEAKPDVVVHLASLFLQTHKPEQVEPLVRSNILFGTNLLEAMAETGVRCLVNTGTSWEHRDGAEDYRPVCLYAATKKAFEDILGFYVDARGFKALTLKLFDTYGPGDPRPKLFAALRRSLTASEPLTFSPGEQTLDLLYIEDVIDAYERAIAVVLEQQAPGAETLFIGSGRGESLRDVVAMFFECAGKPAKIVWGARPYREREVMRAQADLRAARARLGWEPKVGLKEGITKLLAEETA